MMEGTQGSLLGRGGDGEAGSSPATTVSSRG